MTSHREAVFKDYQVKRDARSLSSNLMTPTPASIRDECILLFETKRKKEDMNIIRPFVGVRESADDYQRALRNTRAIKFLTVTNFLRNPSIETSSKNVELLAWLIDYKSDPSKPGFVTSPDRGNSDETTLENILKSQELSKEETVSTGGGQNPSKISGDIKKQEWTKKTDVKLTKKYKGAIIALSVAIVVAIGSFVFQNHNKQCMYWDGDNYVAVDCDATIPGVDVRQLNVAELNNLMWITQADSIKEKHINKVWYIRNNNMVELFTSGGQYPPDRRRRLFPLSKTIYDKYVVTGRVRVK